MSFFSPADLTMLAEANAVAKKEAEEKRLADFAAYLFQRIMDESRDKYAAIKENLAESIRFGSNQIVLWQCKTTKFNRSKVNPDRDCRDEWMVDPATGRKMTHYQYATEKKEHYDSFGMRGTYNIWKILRFTKITAAIAAELGPNFICRHQSIPLGPTQSGHCFQQTITAIYCAKGRSEAEEVAAQKAHAEFPIGRCCDCGNHYTAESVVRHKYSLSTNEFCSHECASNYLPDDYDY
jgi:hypothetical protein